MNLLTILMALGDGGEIWKMDECEDGVGKKRETLRCVYQFEEAGHPFSADICGVEFPGVLTESSHCHDSSLFQQSTLFCFSMIRPDKVLGHQCLCLLYWQKHVAAFLGVPLSSTLGLLTLWLCQFYGPQCLEPAIQITTDNVKSIIARASKPKPSTYAKLAKVISPTFTNSSVTAM